MGDFLLIPTILLVTHVIGNFVSEERNVQSDLYKLAIGDGLTGLYNRRFFTEMLARKMARSIKEKQSLSLLLIDIDHFKPLNDKHGHAAGDRVLESLSKLLIASVRVRDKVFRYGGEEFAIILPSTNMADVQQVAARVHLSIRCHKFAYGPVTVSMGWSTYAPGESEMDGVTLVQQADESLYRAKSEGRDRVVGLQAL